MFIAICVADQHIVQYGQPDTGILAGVNWKSSDKLGIESTQFCNGIVQHCPAQHKKALKNKKVRTLQ